MLGIMEAPSRPEFVPLDHAAAIDALIASSIARPALLFLHDWSCPISERAEDQLLRLKETVHTVDVTTLHELNHYIASATGVRHESPQLFVFHGGRTVFDASHGRIRADVLTALLAELRAGV
jgi:bacillithiol system protein YtxJ